MMPRAFYDAQHFSEVLNLVAQALIRVAPLYVGGAGAARRSSPTKKRCMPRPREVRPWWCLPMGAD